MYPLLESIKLKEGEIQNLEYHQSRLNRSMEELFPGAEKIDLINEISIPEEYKTGTYKIRVLYLDKSLKVEIENYHFRSIQTLKVVSHESIDYHLKYTDRQILELLFSQRGDCDDIIIVKNGFVTDSFAANLLFFDGKGWFTPSTPLLKGTKRQLLLDHGIVAEVEIKAVDIRNYQKVGLINAMIDFEEMPVVALERVNFSKV